MKSELHQLALLDQVDTAAGVGSRLLLTTVSVKRSSKGVCKFWVKMYWVRIVWKLCLKYKSHCLYLYSSIYAVVSKVVAQLQQRRVCVLLFAVVQVWLARLYNYNEISVLGACMRQILNTDSAYNCLFNVHFPSCSTEQTILACLMLECQWCHWLK